MYKIAIIGKRENVLGFMAIGFTVCEAADAEIASEKLKELVKSNEYAAVFVTEDLAMQMEETIAKYKDLPLPAITSIPCEGSNTGYGINNIRASVERAIGTDILFKEN